MYRLRVLTVVALALLLSLSSTGPASLGAATSVFINEIHYDNSGTDTGEAVEVAGPAGTDLAGWSLVLYNGSDNSMYGTTALSGTIPDQDNGFGTVAVTYPTNGIQNGAPDGLALVDGSNTVVQFLSYEGSFTAAGGPADGMTSTDIGVSEGSSTAVGDSLQLTGSGTVYEDFTWAAPQPNTFGAVNTGQTFGSGGGGPSTPPVINEFVFNHAGNDTGAFIEVSGDANTDYSAYTVLELEGDSSIGTIDAVLPVGVTNGAGVWTSPEDVENGTVTLLLVEGFSGSAGDDLDADDDGTLDSTPWTAIIDDIAVSDGDSGDQTYAAVVLTPGYDGISFTVGGASRIPNGTDTDAASDWVRNDFDGLGLAGFLGSIDAGEAVNTPGAVNAQLATNLTPIQAIQTSTGNDSPLVGQTVTTAGVVTGVFPESNGSARVFIQDGAGPWSGLFLFRPTPTPNVGDLVQVTDEVEEFDNLTELAFSSIGILTTNVTVPAPDVLATGDVSQEQWESVLVRVENATVSNEDLGFGEWSVSDSSGDVRVDDLGAYSYTPTNGDALDFVQGALYFSFGDFKIEPRGDSDIGVAPPPAEVCGDTFTPIYDIQGAGLASPIDGSTVSTEGIVVGDFQANDGDAFNTDLGGFFIQDSAGDGDPATSDGIFVFAPSAMDVQVGDRVRIAGEADEFFDLTQLTNVTTVLLCSTGNTVAPTPAALPVTSRDDLEVYEGMLVTFPQTLFISEYFNFDRFGEIVLTTERQFQPTAVYEPGSLEAAQLAQANILGRITLDDGRSNQNPDPARHPNGNVFDLGNRFRGGDTVQDVTGVLSYGFGLYRIQPTAGAGYTPANPRPAAPDDVGGNLTVAAFNVLNYFLTLDDGVNDICGPNQDQECRGADTQEEFDRQRAKIISALSDINADVYGLMEMENTTGVKPLEDIVSGLNDALGAGTYDFVDTGAIGPDAIKVGIIYKPATVSPVGNYAVLNSDAFLDPNNLGEAKNRPAVAQSFIDDTTGGIFTVVVNHLKSKGSGCGAGDDDPEQGSCNLTRTLAAQMLADWLATDPTNSGDADVLIIGDLNSYDKEDPIDALRAGADGVPGTGDDYSDLLFQYLEEFAYSYVFDGQLGYLDYGMANQDLLSEVTGTTVWHINTDEPDILDYDTSFKQAAQDALYEPNAYRSSDHDPVIVGLDVCDEIAPTVDVSVTPDMLWPANHEYVTVEATVSVTDFDPNPTVTLVSVTSNEPDDGTGDGDTADDIVIVDDDTFQLRAERSGQGDGRVYTITYEVTDACGNSTVASAEVTVPHNR